MDSRLKAVLDQAQQEKFAAKKKQDELKEAERIRLARQEELDKFRATVWIQKNIFDCILNAERANMEMCLSDHSNSFGPDHEDIPAVFLAREAAKIDGVTVHPRLIRGQKDEEYGGFDPDYYVYDVRVKR